MKCGGKKEEKRLCFVLNVQFYGNLYILCICECVITVCQRMYACAYVRHPGKHMDT